MTKIKIDQTHNLYILPRYIFISKFSFHKLIRFEIERVGDLWELVSNSTKQKCVPVAKNQQVQFPKDPWQRCEENSADAATRVVEDIATLPFMQQPL